MSVVVPCYNVEAYIQRFIDSLVKQTFRYFEAIFVEDGSTDDGLAILKKNAEKYDFIQVISQKNQGVGMARNKGLFAARGNYILFLDPDDFIEPKLLEENYKLAEETNAEMVIFGFHTLDERGQHLSTTRSNKQRMLKTHQEVVADLPNLIKETNIFVPWNKVYRKAFLDQHQLIFSNQRTGQDSLFNIDVFKKVSSITISPEVYYHYIFARTNSATSKMDQIRLVDDMRICSMFKQFAFSENLPTKFAYSLHLSKLYKNMCKLEYTNKQYLVYLFSLDEIQEFLTVAKMSYFDDWKDKYRFIKCRMMSVRLRKQVYLLRTKS
ncbi:MULTISPECIES: glycosyltransferase family 2 protein [unclassified Enterococcus]|uniref:glycosyltransferase family 2 protein n=1 Tax=unclassified Enterococcus TaxID=2608891 RepID=UPI001CE13F74|nr:MULTISPECIES: glycosyltransferase [unclassified Enterococcus]